MIVNLVQSEDDDEMDDSHKVDQLVAMGFPRGQARVALLENADDLDASIEWLAVNSS
jgi:uncharacterized UBP type Zn finger protein